MKNEPKERIGTHAVTVRLKVSKTLHKPEHIRALLSPELEIELIKFPLKPGTGMAKGSNFERELGHQFSLWWSNGEDKFIFSRRGGSGGSFRDKRGKSGSSGDLTADKPIGEPFTLRFSIEAKFYADLTNQFWNLITGDSCKTIETFWQQTTDSARPYNRYSILILRCNGKQPIVITNDPWFANLEQTFSVKVCNQQVWIFPLHAFFNINPLIFQEELTPPEPPKKVTIERRKKQ